jgi:ribosome-associated toxin RatA of RatAB toxin-antitoxin module
MINFSTKHLLKFPIGLFYNKIVNVKDYKNFVPWCVDSWQDSSKPFNEIQILRKDLLENFPEGKQIQIFKGGIKIGFNILDFSYISNVYTVEPNIVLSVVDSSSSKVFERLESIWLLNENPDETITVDYSINFEFKNIVYSNATSMFLDFIGKDIVQAFIDRSNRDIESRDRAVGIYHAKDVVKNFRFDTEQERNALIMLINRVKDDIDPGLLKVILNKLENDDVLKKRLCFFAELMNEDINKERILKEIKSYV